MIYAEAFFRPRSLRPRQVEAMSSASSWSVAPVRSGSRKSIPRSARRWAVVVPTLPAPTTVILASMVRGKLETRGVWGTGYI